MKDPQLRIERFSMQIGLSTMELRAPVTLRAGRVYIVHGRSGAGKSSFVRGLLGLTEPGRVRGSATIESALDKSQSVTVLDDGDFNTHAAELMAFMPQSGKLGFIDELGVFTNATFFCELDRERAQLAVEKLGGKLRMWPLPSSLATASGGEAMRVSALRALMPRGPDAKPPCVLIADEAGSGLDAEANERLSAALRETALSGETVAIVIAHDAAPLVGKEAAAIRPAEGNDITIYEYTFGEHGLVYAGDAGRLVRTAVADPPGLLERAGKKLAHAFEIGGGVALSPVAFITGCAGIRGRLVPIVLGDILRTVFNPTTWVFVAAAALMVSITVGVFIFQLFPRRELIEPLLLEEILSVTGTVLCLMLMPLFAAVFATAKIGAAQAARLSSSVRSGLLDTLWLARLRSESYALVPGVIGQTLAVALCTAMAVYLGLIAASAIFLGGGSPLALDQAMAFMRMGVERNEGWFGWMLAKVVASGYVAGTIAALFGLAPAESERDVAKAVHRTLLWSMIAVLIVQCAFIIAQFD